MTSLHITQACVEKNNILKRNMLFLTLEYPKEIIRFCVMLHFKQQSFDLAKCSLYIHAI